MDSVMKKKNAFVMKDLVEISVKSDSVKILAQDMDFAYKENAIVKTGLLEKTVLILPAKMVVLDKAFA